jgi:hypothetical protein
VTNDPSELDALTEKAVAAMKQAVALVVEDHRRRGKPLVVWKNGRVVYEHLAAVDRVRESFDEFGVDQPVPSSEDNKSEK